MIREGLESGGLILEMIQFELECKLMMKLKSTMFGALSISVISLVLAFGCGEKRKKENPLREPVDKTSGNGDGSGANASADTAAKIKELLAALTDEKMCERLDIEFPHTFEMNWDSSTTCKNIKEESTSIEDFCNKLNSKEAFKGCSLDERAYERKLYCGDLSSDRQKESTSDMSWAKKVETWEKVCKELKEDADEGSETGNGNSGGDDELNGGEEQELIELEVTRVELTDKNDPTSESGDPKSYTFKVHKSGNKKNVKDYIYLPSEGKLERKLEVKYMNDSSEGTFADSLFISMTKVSVGNYESADAQMRIPVGKAAKVILASQGAANGELITIKSAITHDDTSTRLDCGLIGINDTEVGPGAANLPNLRKGSNTIDLDRYARGVAFDKKSLKMDGDEAVLTLDSENGFLQYRTEFHPFIFIFAGEEKDSGNTGKKGFTLRCLDDDFVSIQ